MKRIGILALILSACFASATWAQQKTGMPRFGKAGIPHYRAPNSTPVGKSLSAITRAFTVQTVKFYELGAYPGGTWAQMMDINEWGVAVGLGDTPAGFDTTLDPPRGYTRPLGVAVLAPHDRRWFDLGTFGGESYQNSYDTADTTCSGITNTGIIVGLAPTTDDPITRIEKYVRAFCGGPQG